MDKIFEHKGLHTELHVSRNSQLVDIQPMQSKFLEFIEETTSPANFQDAKILELFAIDGVLKLASIDRGPWLLGSQSG